MLPFFADPYPDELLYSACARYHSWTGNPDLKDTLKELFGKNTAIPSLYLGARLQHLCDNLGSIYTPEKLLQENTLLPLYLPFMPTQRSFELVEQMKNSSGNGIVAKIGFAAGAICEKKSIAYCPECVVEDRKQYGRAYIHRIHQAQGVVSCPKHGWFLLQTKQHLEISRLEYIDFNSLELYENLFIMPEHRYAERLNFIANSAVYLLSHDLSFADKQKVTMRYKQLLHEKHLVTKSGRIRQEDYLSELQFLYGELLQLLDSPIFPDDEYTWAKVILRNGDRTVHYLRHILLINYMTDIETFFEGIRYEDLFVAMVPQKNQIDNGSLLGIYKKNIINTVLKNPALNRTELRKLINKEYTYVYRRDKQWLFNNLPTRQMTLAHEGYIDWRARDNEYYYKLHEAYKACKAEGGRITVTRLIRRAGIQSNMENKRSKLPRSWKYIENVSQSVEEFQTERCLEIIRAFIINNNEHLPKWKLLRLAGLTDERFQKIKDILKTRLDEERLVSDVEWKIS